MQRLCLALDRALDMSSETGRRVMGWPGDPVADAMVLRVTGGLNALVRAGKAPALASLYPPNPLPETAALEAALRKTLPVVGAALQPWLDGPPQTNEVGRSGVLMPGLMTIAARTGLPLRLFELGASAGLNLRLDDYAYDLGGLRTGRTASAVRIQPEWEGPPPPNAKVNVTERRGVDINPLDVTDPATQQRLLAYVWPDQTARVERLEAALAAAAADPPPIDRADAADWTERCLLPLDGTATVLFHSIAFQYFPRASQQRIAAHMRGIGKRTGAFAPLFWLRYEDDAGSPGALPTLRLTSWSGRPEGDPDEEHLADAHPHGTQVRWRLPQTGN